MVYKFINQLITGGHNLVETLVSKFIATNHRHNLTLFKIVGNRICAGPEDLLDTEGCRTLSQILWLNSSRPSVLETHVPRNAACQSVAAIRHCQC